MEKPSASVWLRCERTAEASLTEAIRCCKLWEGHPENLFDCTLRWTAGGAGSVSGDNVPGCSTGFWRPSADLVKDSFRAPRSDQPPSESYWVGGRNFLLAGKKYKLKYVGLAPADDVIPARSLVRVSLARWWTKGQGEPEACWLQLSGWFPTTPTSPVRQIF